MGVAIGVLGVIPVVGAIVGGILGLCLLILWIISLINALGGKQKPAPVVGKWFQEWFAGIG